MQKIEWIVKKIIIVLLFLLLVMGLLYASLFVMGLLFSYKILQEEINYFQAFKQPEEKLGTNTGTVYVTFNIPRFGWRIQMAI